MAQTKIFDAIRRFSPGPLLPKYTGGGGGDGGGGGGDPAPPIIDAPNPRPPTKGIFVGIIEEGDVTECRRAFARFKISDITGGVPSARLEWHFVDKTLPTGNVALIEIADFDTLDPSDWGIAERATINPTALTPSSTIDTKMSWDVTTRYNQAKTDGLDIFAVKLQYEHETEGVGIGRWYEMGATNDLAPTLVVTVTQGQDVKLTLLATPLTVNTARLDDQGTPAAVIVAGDDTHPPLGADVRMGASIDGLQDDVAGTYTGTPSSLIRVGSDIIYFVLRSPDEGSAVPAEFINLDSIILSRARLATWFPLAGGLTQPQDVRAWIAQIGLSIRSFGYIDQEGAETLYTDPLEGFSDAPIRLITPDEHGLLRLFPIQTESGALYPISRADVFYGFDYLGLDNYQGHAILSAEETDPADAERQAQAVNAQARYGLRGLGGPAEPTAESSYPWVPLDEPGTQTGIRIRNWQWDRAQARLLPAQGLEIHLPRFALGFRLLDVFEVESTAFPSAAARLSLTALPIAGSTGPGPLAYQARRARCVVREMPRLMAETGNDFPVAIVAQIVAWDTP